MRRFGGTAAIGRGATLAAIVWALLALAAPGAASARGFTTGLQDDPLFTSPNPSVRATWLNRASSERAGVIRINVSWRAVATRRPANPTNPADPAYDFSAVDAGVTAASARGFDVLLTVLYAPGWAEGPHRPGTKEAPPGTWKPNPGDLGDFAQALAKRYSGHYAGLPRVGFFQAWNEPNLATYLTPQWHRKKAKSPKLYRRMLNAFYAGVKAAQPGAKVVTAGTAPYGNPPGQERMRPLTFLRGLFCLDRHFKPRKCDSKPHLDILAHHPITTSGGPHKRAINHNDIAMPDFHRVRAVLHAAEKTGHISPRRHHQLWATEFWWNTDPPNRTGVPAGKQARWIEESFYLLWKQGASAAINLEIRDAKYNPHNPFATLQSGLFYYNGKAKPSARSFRFPFVTHRSSKRRIAAWGIAPRSGEIAIQAKKHGGWKTKKRVQAKAGNIFKPHLRLPGSASLRAVVAGDHSLTWHQKG